MDEAKILQEHKDFLKQGYYLFRREGRRILWLTSRLIWKPYAPFEKEKDAQVGLETILEINPKHLECESTPPWRVKHQPEEKRAAV